MKRIMYGSVISLSQQQPNDIYMSIRMRMFSTRPNLNREAVTESFIDEIVNNQDKYLCIPLCADTSKQERGDYRGLGHMYDRKNDRFLSEQIGSFCGFSKVEDEFGISLIGEARVPKRNEKVCIALCEMFEQGSLNFSFEVLAGEVQVIDGITYIDKSLTNTLIGMAVVSIPAYPEAKALALVAEIEMDNMIREVMKNAYVTMAEAEMYTIIRRFFEQLFERIGDKPYSLSMERFCHDCAIFYDRDSAKTYRVDYMVENDEVIITDMYEVVFERKGDEVEMTLEEAMARISELENALNASTADVNTYKSSLDEVKATVAEKEEAITGLNQKVAELESSVEELTPYKAQVEQIEEEKKAAALAERKQKLTTFATKNGLDVAVAEVAEAIENLNYEAIVELAAEAKLSETEESEKNVDDEEDGDEKGYSKKSASFAMGDGIKLEGAYGGILARE